MVLVFVVCLDCCLVGIRYAGLRLGGESVKERVGKIGNVGRSGKGGFLEGGLMHWAVVDAF
jgi:hypothetical protein